MEFSLGSFVDTLRQVIYDNFPTAKSLTNPSGSEKHPNRSGHAKDVVFMNLNPIHTLDTITFDIGSNAGEELYPHYHILEDSEIIHKKGKGTQSSKGSQDKISDKRARDYGIVKWNGKTYTQEYKKNVRGARSKRGGASANGYLVDSEGVVYKVRLNPQANFYENIYYKYIERAIDVAIPILCSTYGLKSRRTQNSGLSEEYALQENASAGLDYTGNIIDILDSFTEE